MEKSWIIELKNEIMNKMDNTNATLNTKLDTTHATLNSKLDHITTRLNTQDLKINDLSQRVESLEKHLTYAEVTKSPPKPTFQPILTPTPILILTPTKTPTKLSPKMVPLHLKRS